MDDPFPVGMVEEWQQILSKPNHSLDNVFKSQMCFPLQRRREMEAMLKAAPAPMRTCQGCDGEGTLMHQMAKNRCRELGGYRERFSYWTPDHKEIEFKTIGGLCTVCLGKKVIEGPRVVMEVGADKGGGAYAWATLKPEMLIAVEVRGCPYKDLFIKAFPQTRFLFLEASSLTDETVELVKEFLGGKTIDALFLDGDKSFFGKDFTIWRPMVKGRVFLHDITDPAPGEAFDEIEVSHDISVLIDRSESWGAMERGKLGIPATCPHESWLRHWAGMSCGVGIVEAP